MRRERGKKLHEPVPDEVREATLALSPQEFFSVERCMEYGMSQVVAKRIADSVAPEVSVVTAPTMREYLAAMDEKMYQNPHMNGYDSFFRAIMGIGREKALDMVEMIRIAGIATEPAKAQGEKMRSARKNLEHTIQKSADQDVIAAWRELVDAENEYSKAKTGSH